MLAVHAATDHNKKCTECSKWYSLLILLQRQLNIPNFLMRSTRSCMCYRCPKIDSPIWANAFIWLCQIANLWCGEHLRATLATYQILWNSMYFSWFKSSCPKMDTFGQTNMWFGQTLNGWANAQSLMKFYKTWCTGWWGSKVVKMQNSSW